MEMEWALLRGAHEAVNLLRLIEKRQSFIVLHSQYDERSPSSIRSVTFISNGKMCYAKTHYLTSLVLFLP